MPDIEDLFDLRSPDVASVFSGCHYPWEALDKLDTLIEGLCGPDRQILGNVHPTACIDDGRVYVAASAIVEAGAYIRSPCYIGPNVLIRHTAYIRGLSIFLDSSLVGHSTEVKQSIFLPG